MRLFLNGDLQFSSVDEHRYHEALVHPAMAGDHARVLILGGGDGLALREVLRYPDVAEVTLVDVDPRVVELARSDPRLAALNGHAFDDRRVEVVAADAFSWLRDADRRFDVVLADLPDADTLDTAKLYTVEFYGLIARALADGGRAAVQAGSPYFAPAAFWGVEASIAEAGLRTAPYHVDVPPFGDWGFVLASDEQPSLRMSPDAPPLAFLTPEVLTAATVFPPRPAPHRRRTVNAARPAHPRLPTRRLAPVLTVPSNQRSARWVVPPPLASQYATPVRNSDRGEPGRDAELPIDVFDVPIDSAITEMNPRRDHLH